MNGRRARPGCGDIWGLHQQSGIPSCRCLPEFLFLAEQNLDCKPCWIPHQPVSDGAMYITSLSLCAWVAVWRAGLVLLAAPALLRAEQIGYQRFHQLPVGTAQQRAETEQTSQYCVGPRLSTVLQIKAKDNCARFRSHDLIYDSNEKLLIENNLIRNSFCDTQMKSQLIESLKGPLQTETAYPNLFLCPHVTCQCYDAFHHSARTIFLAR